MGLITLINDVTRKVTMDLITLINDVTREVTLSAHEAMFLSIGIRRGTSV